MLILIILILLLCGAFPAFPYNANWGYFPFGGILLLILVVYLLGGLRL